MLRLMTPQPRLCGDYFRDSLGDSLGSTSSHLSSEYPYSRRALSSSSPHPYATVARTPPSSADPSLSPFPMNYTSGNGPIRPRGHRISSARNASYSHHPHMDNASMAAKRHDSLDTSAHYGYGMVTSPGASMSSHAGSMTLGSAHHPSVSSYAGSQHSDHDGANSALISSTNSPSGVGSGAIAPHSGLPQSVGVGASTQMPATWHGLIHTTMDALIIIEACLQGMLQHCPRRPHDRERDALIKSGSVFVYEESTSGIKRWTDGLSWSPSRIMGNFLLYRQLERPFPPGEKKRAKRNREREPDSLRAEPYPSQSTIMGEAAGRSPGNTSFRSEDVRKITGSLVDSYDFKEGGLLKKTISVIHRGSVHHLIAYYTIQDAQDNRLSRPGFDRRLDGCQPRKELTQDQKFRGPIQDPDDSYPWPTGPASQPSHHMQSLGHMSSYATHNPHYLHQSIVHPSYHSGVPSNLPSSMGNLHLAQSSYPAHTMATSHDAYGATYPATAGLVTGSSYSTSGAPFSQHYSLDPSHAGHSQSYEQPAILEDQKYSIPEYSSVEPQTIQYGYTTAHHGRHDTMGSFDEKTPQFSNAF